VGAVAGLAMTGIATGYADGFGSRKEKEVDDRVSKGLQLAPVPLRFRGLDPSLVGLGSYIVNAQGGCNDCHTAPPYEEDGNPFMGDRERISRDKYLAGGQRFGPFVSRNLTPDEDRKPGGLTWEQFRQVMRKGTDFRRTPDETPLLQVMPWPVYRHMSNNELRAIYEFLRAIPSLPTTPAPPLEPAPAATSEP
jgi:hypothetical protein